MKEKNEKKPGEDLLSRGGRGAHVIAILLVKPWSQRQQTHIGFNKPDASER